MEVGILIIINITDVVTIIIFFIKIRKAIRIVHALPIMHLKLVYNKQLVDMN